MAVASNTGRVGFVGPGLTTPHSISERLGVDLDALNAYITAEEVPTVTIGNTVLLSVDVLLDVMFPAE